MNQSLSIRLAALDGISNSKDPNLQIALEEVVKNADFVADELMKQTLYTLVQLESKPSSEAITEGLRKSEEI